MTMLEEEIDKKVKTGDNEESIIHQKKLFNDGLFNIVYSAKRLKRRSDEPTDRIFLQKVDG